MSLVEIVLEFTAHKSQAVRTYVTCATAHVRNSYPWQRMRRTWDYSCPCCSCSCPCPCPPLLPASVIYYRLWLIAATTQCTPRLSDSPIKISRQPLLRRQTFFLWTAIGDCIYDLTTEAEKVQAQEFFRPHFVQLFHNIAVMSACEGKLALRNRQRRRLRVTRDYVWDFSAACFPPPQRWVVHGREFVLMCSCTLSALADDQEGLLHSDSEVADFRARVRTLMGDTAFIVGSGRLTSMLLGMCGEASSWQAIEAPLSVMLAVAKHWGITKKTGTDVRRHLLVSWAHTLSPLHLFAPSSLSFEPAQTGLGWGVCLLACLLALSPTAGMAVETGVVAWFAVSDVTFAPRPARSPRRIQPWSRL